MVDPNYSGFRASELCALRWDQANLDQGLIHIDRVKQGVPSVHPLRGPELRVLRKLRREISVCLYYRARRADDNIRLSKTYLANWCAIKNWISGSPTYAAPRMWL